MCGRKDILPVSASWEVEKGHILIAQVQSVRKFSVNDFSLYGKKLEYAPQKQSCNEKLGGHYTSFVAICNSLPRVSYK